jgi:hypothetical protein
VDVGALLSRLAAAFTRSKNTGVLSLISAAQASYQACISVFQKDNDLPDVRAAVLIRGPQKILFCSHQQGCSNVVKHDRTAAKSHRPSRQLRAFTPLRQPTTSHNQGTGMAIYFPTTRVAYDPWYTSFVGSFPAAMDDWDTFLTTIYGTGESIASGASQRE